MPTLLYLHGFLSSPLSQKAVQVKEWLAANRPDIRYQCPFLTPYFGEVRSLLVKLIEELSSGPVYLMGSSLGGYWATYLAERYNLRAVLINPAVTPSVFDRSYIGVELKNYHTDDVYVLTEQHIQELLIADTPEIKLHGNYFLMVQTGDETLDYRLAVEKYKNSKQLIEQGGDHSFRNFELQIPEAIDFLLSG